MTCQGWQIEGPSLLGPGLPSFLQSYHLEQEGPAPYLASGLFLMGDQVTTRSWSLAIPASLYAYSCSLIAKVTGCYSGPLRSPTWSFGVCTGPK